MQIYSKWGEYQRICAKFFQMNRETALFGIETIGYPQGEIVVNRRIEALGVVVDFDSAASRNESSCHRVVIVAGS